MAVSSVGNTYIQDTLGQVVAHCQHGPVVEVRLLPTVVIVRSSVVEITVYTADETK